MRHGQNDHPKLGRRPERPRREGRSGRPAAVTPLPALCLKRNRVETSPPPHHHHSPPPSSSFAHCSFEVPDRPESRNVCVQQQHKDSAACPCRCSCWGGSRPEGIWRLAWSLPLEVGKMSHVCMCMVQFQREGDQENRSPVPILEPFQKWGKLGQCLGVTPPSFLPQPPRFHNKLPWERKVGVCVWWWCV